MPLLPLPLLPPPHKRSHDRVRAVARLVDHAITSKGLDAVVKVLQKPAPKRTREEVQQCVKFLSKHQFENKFLRNKRRSQIEQLCRTMSAVVVPTNHVLYEQGDYATHAYVVVEGRMGTFVEEDAAIKSDYEVHMHRTRVLALAGKMTSQLSDAHESLEAAKRSVGLPSAMALSADMHDAAASGKKYDARAPVAAVTRAAAAAGGGPPSQDQGKKPVKVKMSSTWFEDDEEAQDDGELDVDVGGGREASAAAPEFLPRKRDPQLLWRWAFTKILTMLRTGGAMIDLANFARKHDGKKWVQVQLWRKGDLFGEVDLFHRTRSACARCRELPVCVCAVMC